MTLIERAKAYAAICHRGQKDDEGKSYFKAHVCQVARLVKEVTNDEVTIAAAYLHDVIEDADVPKDNLVMLFGTEVADLVHELTHEGAKPTGYTFPRLHSKKAILIKFADRLSNLSRMNAWDDDRQAHYLKRSKFWK